jgi:hypothetical protein
MLVEMVENDLVDVVARVVVFEDSTLGQFGCLRVLLDGYPNLAILI